MDVEVCQGIEYEGGVFSGTRDYMGLPNGLGKIVWDNGDSYDGEWVSGRRHGYGVYRKPESGVTYKGNMSSNFYCDEFGYMVDIGNGWDYTGGFECGKMCGFGHMNVKHGVTRGIWRNSKLNGHGYAWDKRGSIAYGTWCNGSLVQGTETVYNASRSRWVSYAVENGAKKEKRGRSKNTDAKRQHSKQAIFEVRGGYCFASRLEARWSVFFEHIGMPYAYEPHTFGLGSNRSYTPDFLLPTVSTWIEVKSNIPTAGEREKALHLSKLVDDIKSKVYILYGPPTAPLRRKWVDGAILVMFEGGKVVEPMAFYECELCGSVTIEMVGMLTDHKCMCSGKGTTKTLEGKKLSAAYRAAYTMCFEDTEPRSTKKVVVLSKYFSNGSTPLC